MSLIEIDTDKKTVTYWDDEGKPRKETWLDRHPIIDTLLFDWELRGYLVDDAIVIIKYLLVAIILYQLIAPIYTCTIADQTQAGPWLNGCWERTIYG